MYYETKNMFSLLAFLTTPYLASDYVMVARQQSELFPLTTNPPMLCTCDRVQCPVYCSPMWFTLCSLSASSTSLITISTMPYMPPYLPWSSLTISSDSRLQPSPSSIVSVCQPPSSESDSSSEKPGQCLVTVCSNLPSKVSRVSETVTATLITTQPSLTL